MLCFIFIFFNFLTKIRNKCHHVTSSQKKIEEAKNCANNMSHISFAIFGLFNFSLWWRQATKTSNTELVQGMCSDFFSPSNINLNLNLRSILKLLQNRSFVYLIAVFILFIDKRGKHSAPRCRLLHLPGDRVHHDNCRRKLVWGLYGKTNRKWNISLG